MANGAANNDAAQILEEAAMAARLNVEAISQDISKTMAAATRANTAEQAAITAAANAANDAATAQGRLKIAAEVRNRDAASQFGTNPDASTYVGRIIADRIIGLQDNLDQRHVQLQEKMDLGFTDDPIQWIMNQFTLPGEVAAYNSLSTKKIELDQTLKSLQDQTQEQIATNNAIATTTSEGILAAQNRERLAASQKAVAESEFRMQQLGMQHGNIRLATSRESFNIVASLDSHRIQEAQLRMSQANNQLARERLELDKELKELQLEIRRENKQAEAIFQKKLNSVSATLGYKPISFQEWKLADPKTQAFWWELANNPLIENGIAGKNTAEAITMLAQQQAPLTPTTRPVMDNLMHIRQAVIKENEMLWKSLDPAARQVKIQDRIEQELKRQFNNVPDKGSIFSPPPLVDVVNIPAVKGTVIGQMVAPLATSPMVTTKSNDFFQAAISAVGEGKLSADQAAAEIAQIYTTIRIANNQDRQYQKFALKPMDKFNATVDTGAMWNGKVTVDLTNPTAVKATILRTIVQRRATDIAAEIAPFLNVPKGAM